MITIIIYYLDYSRKITQKLNYAVSKAHCFFLTEERKKRKRKLTCNKNPDEYLSRNPHSLVLSV